MESSEVIVRIKRSPVGDLIGRAVNAGSHVVFPGIDQFDRRVHLPGNECGLHQPVGIGPPSETAAQARHLDVDLVQG